MGWLGVSNGVQHGREILRAAAGTHAYANSDGYRNSDRDCDPNGNAYFDANCNCDGYAASA